MPSDSLRAAARVVASPRAWGVLLAVSGWAWSAAVFVAATPRRSEIDTLQLEQTKAIDTLKLEQTKAIEAFALRLTYVEQRRLQTHEQTALALRALVGLLARERGRGAQQKNNEQAAAERRFDSAMRELASPAAAVRAALGP